MENFEKGFWICFTTLCIMMAVMQSLDKSPIKNDKCCCRQEDELKTCKEELKFVTEKIIVEHKNHIHDLINEIDTCNKELKVCNEDFKKLDKQFNKYYDVSLLTELYSCESKLNTARDDINK